MPRRETLSEVKARKRRDAQPNIWMIRAEKQVRANPEYYAARGYYPNSEMDRWL